MNDTLSAAYDPETFRREGHALIDRLSDYLAAAKARDLPVVDWREPEDQAKDWEIPSQTMSLNEIAERYLARSIHLQHPRCLGHQVPPPLPAAALGDLLLALTNNSAAVYEMSPAGTSMERAAVRWLAQKLALSATADGIFTAGGSLGNFTGLLAARQSLGDRDIWEKGSEGEPLAVLASEHAHYSISRAARILGWGAKGVIPVRTDDSFRIEPSALPAALSEASRRGRRPVAVVATSGSTATGSFDPLEEIAAFCSREGLWLHVDGAHGGAAAISQSHKHLVRGIELADSVVIDAHKLLGCPSLTTALLFRDGESSFKVFSQQASYLFAETRPAWFDFAQRTLECTKRPIGARLWVVLAQQGEATLSAIVDRCFELGTALGNRVEQNEKLELLVRPAANIVCFRLKNATDEAQSRIRKRLRDRGLFYVVETRLRNAIWLRCAIMNPLTTEADLDALLSTIAP